MISDHAVDSICQTIAVVAFVWFLARITRRA